MVMRKTLFAFGFALFCAVVPLLLAKAVAQAQELQEVEASDSESSIEIRLETEGLDPEQDEQIRDAVERLTSVVDEVKGDRVNAVVDLQLENITDADKKQIRSKLDDVLGGSHIRVSGAGIGVPEMILGLVAICLTLGLPVLILLVVFIFAQKKRRQMMELAGMYIKADQPMPEHVMAEFGSGMSANNRLRSGVLFLLVGIAVMAILGVYAQEAATFGLIPIAVGLARIIYWRYESKQSANASQDDLLELADQ